MRKLIFLTILLTIIVGCSQKVDVGFDENSILVIEERVSTESSVNYEVINEIKEKEIVRKVIDVLKGAKWQTNIEVQMDREPDFKLNKTYHIWVTPHSDMLEIINTSNSNYVRLSERDSSDLNKIMTGTELELHY